MGISCWSFITMTPSSGLSNCAWYDLTSVVRSEAVLSSFVFGCKAKTLWPTTKGAI